MQQTAQLPMSETPLTPNVDIDGNEVAFNFDCIETIEHDQKCNDNEKPPQTMKSKPVLDVLMESNHDNDEQEEEEMETEIEVSLSPHCKLIDDDAHDHEDEKQDEHAEQEQEEEAVLERDEDDVTESTLLAHNGYTKIKKMTDTLQGCVFLAFNENAAKSNQLHDGQQEYQKQDPIVVIKRTSKFLHEQGITIQNGRPFNVKENILREYDVLHRLSAAANCPSSITKLVDFFETQYNYYMVMEYGGDDFFEFIVEAHQHINDEKLSVRTWRKFVKYLLYQMVAVVSWLHNEMNCCHLDISLENITVQNNKFILQADGTYTIDPNIKIKFIDFGLAEFFDPVDRFQCVKYCGKTTYKSPQVYRAKEIFDARQADIWSLGVVLFCMAVGAPPYVKPSNNDQGYKYFIRTGKIDQLLFQWNRHYCVTVKMLDLLHNMLQADVSLRYYIEDVLKHPWLSVYYRQYQATYQRNQIQARPVRSVYQQLSIYKLPIATTAHLPSSSVHHKTIGK